MFSFVQGGHVTKISVLLFSNNDLSNKLQYRQTKQRWHFLDAWEHGVAKNIGKIFFSLLNARFPANNKLHKWLKSYNTYKNYNKTKLQLYDQHEANDKKITKETSCSMEKTRKKIQEYAIAAIKLHANSEERTFNLPSQRWPPLHARLMSCGSCHMDWKSWVNFFINAAIASDSGALPQELLDSFLDFFIRKVV